MSTDAHAGAPTVAALGDAALVVRFAEPVGDPVLARVMGLLAALDRTRPPAVVDVVPGYASVVVIFDPARARPDDVRAEVERAIAQAAPAPPERARHLEIPVLYDPSVAPDLEPLARDKGMSPAELAARHAAPTYRCHMLGFRPGFPFLGGLDPALAAPRLPTPRSLVPAGSVGIGGRQTGVYPGPGPGGWRIIGRTPVRLFDPGRAEPFLVAPGDLVTFVPIDEGRFRALAAGGGAAA